MLCVVPHGFHSVISIYLWFCINCSFSQKHCWRFTWQSSRGVAWGGCESYEFRWNQIDDLESFFKNKFLNRVFFDIFLDIFADDIHMYIFPCEMLDWCSLFQRDCLRVCWSVRFQRCYLFIKTFKQHTVVHISHKVLFLIHLLIASILIRFDVFFFFEF